MKTILLAAASALLVAGCATDPYGSGPYGPGYGYPPPGAYPPGTYPPGSYPPGSYPPGAYPPGGEASCPIRTSRNWNAFVNRMPGPDARPQLVISGDVVTATAGYQVSFDPHLKIRESYPAQAVAVLRVRPPDGPAAQVVETHQVRWQWPLTQPVGSVEIVCEGETLARISQVQSAY